MDTVLLLNKSRQPQTSIYFLVYRNQRTTKKLFANYALREII